ADHHVRVDDNRVIPEAGEVAEVGRLAPPLDFVERADSRRSLARFGRVDSRLSRIRHEHGSPGAVALSEDRGGEGVDLRVGQRFPTEGAPGRGGRADTGANTDELHPVPLSVRGGSVNGVALRLMAR